ncbi:MAG: hypothetical protein HUJ58_05190, partial [Erysipelotrichaceae bacterium]|nr:hypothetical protein [Erysipelotrichaceae bacterium]
SGKTSLVKNVTFSLTKDEEHNVTVSVDTMEYMDGIQIKYKQGSNGTYCSAKSYAGPFEDDSYFEKAFALKKGKTYYFTVRCYKYDAKGNKIYSPWSSTKKITA